jgi:transcriptional regulator with XRE-family HTH domain
MDAGQMLKEARRREGLSQRDLAGRANVPQPVIARLESGGAIPRVDTLDKLLRECGEGLVARPRRGEGIDRSLIRGMLRLSPGDRLRAASDEANSLNRLGVNAR